LADDAACAWHGFLWLLRSGGQRHRFHLGFDGLGLVALGALEVKHGLQIPVTAAVAQLANETGLGRESLYKALSGEGNPSFATILKVIQALGLKLGAVHVAHA
jgi:transcriptional regulator with XRE-family HTH domain